MLFFFLFFKILVHFLKNYFFGKIVRISSFFSVKCIKSFLKIFAFLTFLRVESKKRSSHIDCFLLILGIAR